MLIAIPVATDKGEDSVISEHFGYAPYYAFVKIEEDKIVSIDVEPNPFSQHGPGQIPGYMRGKGVEILIARGIGRKAIEYLNEYGIQVIRGAHGTVKEIVQDFLEGKLESVEYEPKERFHGEKPRRIAIPSTAGDPEAEIDQRFARAPYIAIFDEATGQFEFHENKEAEVHGAGPKMAQFLADKNVDVLITANVGTNAYEALRMAGIEVYLFQKGTIKEALEAFKEGKLSKVGGPTYPVE